LKAGEPMTLRRRAKQGTSNGYTFIEIMMTVVVATILVLGLARFLSVTLKGANKTGQETQSMAAVHKAFVVLERDFMDMNQLEECRKTSIVFQMDSYRKPTYSRTANPDMDTAANGRPLTNRFDPDDDGDALDIVAPAERYRVGYDLYDEDDDNPPNGIDVLCRYRVEGGKLLRDFNYDGAGWTDESTVVAGLVNGEFVYEGSLRQMFDASIDCGEDGDCATPDPGNQDGIVTAREIDWTLPAKGGGNRNGEIDTPEERRYVAIVRVTLQHDENQDNKADYSLSNDLAPPFLLLKQMRP